MFLNYDKLTKAHNKKRIKVQNVPENLPIDVCLDQDEGDGNLPPMTALDGDEDIKLEPEETIAARIKRKCSQKRKATRAGLKMSFPSKALIRPKILLAQIKAVNNSYRFENEIQQILYLLYQLNKIKSLQQFNEVIVIMKENMIVRRDPKTFCFSFDFPKNVDENLKRKIEFIIKSNELLQRL